MQVDFYMLSTPTLEERDHFLCRLVEKIYRQQHPLYIHCKNRQEAHHLDQSLWTFSDISFIPHNLLGEGPNTPPPVQLGFDGTPTQRDVLINLSTTIPLFYVNFKRILETVLPDAAAMRIADEHRHFYASQQFIIKTHTIG